MRLLLALISAAVMAAPAHAQLKREDAKQSQKADAKKNKAGSGGLKVDPNVKKLKKAEKK